MINNKRAILLVEDDGITAAAQAQTIRRFGYEVIIANFGEEAVQLACQNEAISLVLMDIDLGRGIDGPRAAQLILAKRHVPIVFLTSHSEREIVEKVRGITRYGYVIKNSGDFVLQSSIEMAFELFDAHENLRIQHELGLALNSTVDLLQGLDDVLKALLQLEGTDSGGIYVADPASGSLDLMAHKGLSPEFIKHVSHYGPDSPNVRMAMAGKAIFGSYSDICPPDDDILMSEGLRAVAFMPVLSQGQLIAVINLGSHSRDYISANTRVSLETLASTIGSALMRLRTNAARLESEEKYQRITENMSDIVSEVDALGIVRYISPSYRRILGDNPEEHIGSSAFDAVHPEDRDRVRAVYSEAALRKSDREAEYRFRHADGHYIWLRTSGHALFDAAGGLVGAILTSSDISERKQAEEALRIAEARYRLLFEHSPDGILIIDPATARPLEFNEAAHRQLEYTREEFSNLSIFDLEVSETPEETRSRIAQVIREGRDDFETLQRTRDGKIRNVLVTAQMTQIPGYSAYHCIWRDITDRRLAEEELRKSESRFRSYFDMPLVGVAITSPGKGWMEVNDRTCEMLGYSRSELKHLTWPELTHPDDVAADEEQFERVLSGQIESYTLDKRFIRKDGGVVWTALGVGCVRNPDGSVNYIVALLNDITERKRAEEVLLESEIKYRQLFDHAPAGIYEVDFIRRRFTKVNSLICEYTGYTEAEFLDMDPLDILTEESKKDFLGRFEKFMAGEPVPANAEFRIREKGGHTRWVAINTEFQRHNGRITGATVVAYDIAERKLAEKKIKDLLAEKELLLKEVHHRVKNNMNTMISLLSIQAGTVKDPHAVAALNDAGNRMRSMGVLYDKLYRSEDMRDMSVRYYLTSLVDEIISLFPNSAAVKVEKHIDDFVLSVKALSPLGIIVNELIANAMKYAFTGRDCGMITVAASLSDNRATLVIGDNGTGIPESVDMENSGGFGLKLVGMLTEQLGGTIEIERGKGTRFVLEFGV